MPTNKPEVVLPELPYELEVLVARLYADAYQAGHDATVEGEFIDLHPNDRDTYWLDRLREHEDVLAYAALTRPADGEFVMVPREPTKAMVAAGNEASDWHIRDADDVYRAMLSAAPQQHGLEVVDDWRDRERLSLLAFRTLLEGFEVSIEAAPLEPPATYLDRVTLTREFQPGGGGPELAKRIAKALSESPRGIAQQPAEAVAVAVDLEQFREAVEYTLRRYEGDEGYPRGAQRMRKLLAIIDTPPTAIDIHQAAKAVADIEDAARELLAQAERGPQNDYGLVHRRIAHQAIAAALRTTPPAIDIGKLRELVERLHSEAGNEQRDGNHGAYGGMSYCADQLAALIGDGGEKADG